MSKSACARVGAWAKVRDGRRDVNGKNAFLSRKVGQKSRAKRNDTPLKM